MNVDKNQNRSPLTQVSWHSSSGVLSESLSSFNLCPCVICERQKICINVILIPCELVKRIIVLLVLRYLLVIKAAISSQTKASVGVNNSRSGRNETHWQAGSDFQIW